MQLILANTANSWDGPAWVILLVCLSSVLSFLASLGVALILYRNRQVDDRLARGDGKFDELMREQANLAVRQAVAGGQIEKSMWQNFVSNGMFESHRRDMMKAQQDTSRVFARIEEKVDGVIRRLEEKSAA